MSQSKHSSAPISSNYFRAKKKQTPKNQTLYIYYSKRGHLYWLWIYKRGSKQSHALQGRKWRAVFLGRSAALPHISSSNTNKQYFVERSGVALLWQLHNHFWESCIRNATQARTHTHTHTHAHARTYARGQAARGGEMERHPLLSGDTAQSDFFKSFSALRVQLVKPHPFLVHTPRWPVNHWAWTHHSPGYTWRHTRAHAHTHIRSHT